ncbi:hypothetical protein DACRYDRAFT_72917 [Dacryopinax primogenitus]|uniref:Metallo-beta-lactamase domain-containing protein n=1 Tax=Dacryopinax primogenitus (strain DJM 731) TaxID=1858805 RepID=M5FN26_DACPD|nr:uncharacterized protein DACRYDRAFT_72917 [Dacryopinax primogenitus]EJT96710.1 hypothetical protein DACRYDRAFT_72917 [Dacryopinax primogenitus]
MAPRAELIFHGTGTSSCLPNIACITASPTDPRCETCWLAADASRGAAVDLQAEEAIRNRRRNTGAILRYSDPAKGEETVIVVDAGKSFVQAAIEWFPVHNLREIDGLLLTHAHADAMNGLDDLRGWTLHGRIQKHIDIYLTQRTFDEVKRTFPYLVDKGMATGGGDVPDFVWHIISEFDEVEIKGVKVVPLLLHHGRYFEPQATLSLASPLPTRPETPNPGFTPKSGASTPLLKTNGLAPPNTSIGNLLPSTLYAKPIPTPIPYPSLGFLFPKFLYFSDVSEIPTETTQYLSSLAEEDKPQVLIIDCLRPKPHMSHFGFAQSIQAVKQFSLTRSYIIGMTCGTASEFVTHRGWAQLCGRLSEGRPGLDEDRWQGSEGERRRCEAALHDAQAAIGSPSSPWVRPCFDGMRILVDEKDVSDDVYDDVYGA